MEKVTVGSLTELTAVVGGLEGGVEGLGAVVERLGTVNVSGTGTTLDRPAVLVLKSTTVWVEVVGGMAISAQ